MMMETAATNTILQTIVEEDKRGRVMSFYATAFVGMAPLGSLLAGSLASRIGAVHTVQLPASCALPVRLLFTRQLPVFRRMSGQSIERMGILPELHPGCRQRRMRPSMSLDESGQSTRVVLFCGG